MYQLIRTTPSGVEKTQGPFVAPRNAAMAASYVLHDNARIPKAQAQVFAVTLRRAPLGTPVRHAESGYGFRIAKVEA